MFLRSTASAIASASTTSFLFDFTNGFANCAGISRNVPLLAQRSAKKVSPCACLQTDQRSLKVGRVRQQLLLRELLLHQQLAGCSECHKVRRRLPQVDANGLYLQSDDPP